MEEISRHFLASPLSGLVIHKKSWLIYLQKIVTTRNFSIFHINPGLRVRVTAFFRLARARLTQVLTARLELKPGRISLSAAISRDVNTGRLHRRRGLLRDCRIVTSHWRRSSSGASTRRRRRQPHVCRRLGLWLADFSLFLHLYRTASTGEHTSSEHQ